MTLSSSLSPMAVRMIDKQGETCTLEYAATSNGTYDPLTGDYTKATVSTVTVKAVFMDFALLSMGTLTSNTSIVQQGDKQVYLSVKDVTGSFLDRAPSPTGDVLVDSKGNRWIVKLVKEYNPLGTLPIMYDLLVRK